MIPTLGARSISNALANPKNVEILFDAVNPKLSYYKRYSAGIRLLDIAKNHLLEESSQASGEAKEKIDEILEGFETFYQQALDNAPENEDAEEPIEFKGIGPEETEDINVEEIEESINLPVDVPKPNDNFDMASVVSGIPDPIPSGPAGMDPRVMAQLESVGLPLFSAKHGGIASLMGNKKPQPMVA